MNRVLIEDDAEARAIADAYGVSESMMYEINLRLPDSLAAGTGLVIGAKRAAPVKDLQAMNGPFEFVFITYMAGFIEGENGWSVVRWSDVSWDELPVVMEEIELVEKTLIPLAVGADTATPKFEAHMKSKNDKTKTNLTGQG